MVRTARSRERNTGVQGDLLLAHQRVGRDAGDARHLRVSPCRSRARQRGARRAHRLAPARGHRDDRRRQRRCERLRFRDARLASRFEKLMRGAALDGDYRVRCDRIFGIIASMEITLGRARSAHDVGEAWTTADATELYEIARWGKGYFSIGDNGQVKVHPTQDPKRSIDLKQLVDDLQRRGISLPALIRFRDILAHLVKDIHDAFQAAIAQNEYKGNYVCVYPIKVNQQRHVVEEVFEFGRPFNFGLEAGSKPELMAVAAIADNDTPIICNGFKDAEFIEMAMLAQKIGRNIIPVVEKYTELELILDYAEKVGVRPQIGMRVKLAARGGGRWQSSGGYRSKFGLTVGEILRGLDELKKRGMEDCFKLLHFHLGSQIPNIRIIKGALTEAGRVYVELHKAGAGLRYMDVGGGLGVDYDGSQTNFESSLNYTLEEYASDVVYHLQTVCDEANVPHPTIVSESGRAIVAHHSLLVFNVLGVSGFGDGLQALPKMPSAELEQPLIDLIGSYDSLNSRNA